MTIFIDETSVGNNKHELYGINTSLPKSKKANLGKLSDTRIVYPITALPNLEHDADFNNKDKLIEYHAAARVELIFQSLVIYYRKGLRSDGSQRQFSMEIGGARIQVDQAHKIGYHAAHRFPASGVMDNIWKKMIEEIDLEKKVTPQKKKVIEGLHRAHYKLQEEILDDEKIVSDSNRGIVRNLFADTPAEVNINRTDIVETTVNLSIDKALENKVRDNLLVDIFRRAAYGEDPHQLTKIFVEESKAHFKSRIEILQKKCEELMKKRGAAADSAKIIKKIQYTQLEYNGTIEPHYPSLIGKLDPQTGLKVQLHGDELFEESIKLLEAYHPKDVK